MTPGLAALGDPLLVAAAALGFGAWQLWSVRRDQRRFGDHERRRPDAGAEQDRDRNPPR
jgi:hypothetical protein